MRQKVYHIKATDLLLLVSKTLLIWQRILERWHKNLYYNRLFSRPSANLHTEQCVVPELIIQITTITVHYPVVAEYSCSASYNNYLLDLFSSL